MAVDRAVSDKVKELIREQLGVDEAAVTSKASFVSDLGADSLDLVEMIMAVEEEFAINIPDEEAEKMQIVEDVINYIELHAK